MFVSIYYKPSLFNAHTMILIVHIFMNVNKLCLNQEEENVFPWTFVHVLHCVTEISVIFNLMCVFDLDSEERWQSALFQLFFLLSVFFFFSCFFHNLIRGKLYLTKANNDGISCKVVSNCDSTNHWSPKHVTNMWYHLFFITIFRQVRYIRIIKPKKVFLVTFVFLCFVIVVSLFLRFFVFSCFCF